MNMHLHHATAYATTALANITGVSFYTQECGSPELSDRALSQAREGLTSALARLDAYEAERAAKSAKAAA